ncbi:hypothetical protein PR048_020896 [Dryococelus australis]|uniref:Uncharacterized protein n=1 Tax=Dryococelus australis TaxID=614101 RepID=A0ABQ9GWP7_9NEOP|nr:hypothetical protein PR048_020896 [Dryococelus australis]
MGTGLMGRNMQGIKTLDVLNQVRWEMLTENDYHRDDEVDVLLRYHLQPMDDTHYIQQFRLPFTVYLMCTQQLDVFLQHYGSEKIAVFHFDSTSGVLRNTKSGANIFYYAGVVHISNSILPVFEMLTVLKSENLNTQVLLAIESIFARASDSVDGDSIQDMVDLSDMVQEMDTGTIYLDSPYYKLFRKECEKVDTTPDSASSRDLAHEVSDDADDPNVVERWSKRVKPPATYFAREFRNIDVSETIRNKVTDFQNVVSESNVAVSPTHSSNENTDNECLSEIIADLLSNFPRNNTSEKGFAYPTTLQANEIISEIPQEQYQSIKMPIKYVRKSEQQTWDFVAMGNAIETPFSRATKQFNVPYNTLKRKVIGKNRDAVDD